MFLTFDNQNWFFDLIRKFFGGIDYLVYKLIAWILEGIFNLAGLTANSKLIETLYHRIYVVLGIYMIFKLSMSFIKYLVDPDSMNDKEQGVGKLISKVLIMLCMMIMLPSLFFTKGIIPGSDGTILQTVQDGVIATLPKLILGINDSSSVEQNASKYGEYMSLMMLRSFYYPNVCNPDSTLYDESKNCNAVEDGNLNIADLSSFNTTIVASSDGSTYDYEYMWPLTTIAGVVLVVILIGLAIDVAIRTFKMLILEMIAPVPIMSYIDPKSAKEGAFSKWIHTFITTYIDIFMKLGIVYLILLLLSKMFEEDGLFEGGIGSIQGFTARTFVRVFLILGLFKFAKDAPKFIKDALGIKDSGDGGGFMGKFAAGAAGAAAGFAGGVMAGGGLSGGLSGMAKGFGAGKNGKPGEAYSQVRDEEAKLLGKSPGGLSGKLQQRGMQRMVRNRMKINEKNLGEEKEAAKKAEVEARKKEFELQSIDPYSDPDAYAEKLDAWETAAMDAEKKRKRYDKHKETADQVGMGSKERIGSLGRLKNKVLDSMPERSTRDERVEHLINSIYEGDAPDIIEARKGYHEEVDKMHGGLDGYNTREERIEGRKKVNEKRKVYFKRLIKK